MFLPHWRQQECAGVTARALKACSPMVPPCCHFRADGRTFQGARPRRTAAHKPAQQRVPARILRSGYLLHGHHCCLAGAGPGSPGAAVLRPDEPASAAIASIELTGKTWSADPASRRSTLHPLRRRHTGSDVPENIMTEAIVIADAPSSFHSRSCTRCSPRDTLGQTSDPSGLILWRDSPESSACSPCCCWHGSFRPTAAPSACAPLPGASIADCLSPSIGQLRWSFGRDVGHSPTPAAA